MRNYENNTIVKLTFQFALDIMVFSEGLREQKRFAFADQVLRSGCSIGANVKEAQGAESKVDFIHKLKIASKEAEEFDKNYLKPGKLLQDIESILKVLAKIISTSKKSKPNPIEN
jgi:four helix bundle protein